MLAPRTTSAPTNLTEAAIEILPASLMGHVADQGAWLASVVGGYYAYHAVPTNIRALGALRYQVVRAWHRVLRRRSQHDRTNWSRMHQLSERWIPVPRILHPWPEERFDGRTRGRSRVR